MKKKKGTRRLTKNTTQGVYTFYFINKVTIVITFCTIYVSQSLHLARSLTVQS